MTAPPELEPDDAGLFGAAVSAATYQPAPTVAIGGVVVAAGAATAGPAGLMVVDGFTVNWGRDDVLEQPAPATGRLTLFDPSKTWATSADRRGLAVTIRHDGNAPGVGPFGQVFFRGRIGSPITVTRKTVYDPVSGETVDGSLVTLPLQGSLVDAANIVPTTAWPVESLGARFDRLVALAQASGLLAGGGSMRAYWRTPDVAAVAAKDQDSLLGQLTACYDSSGMDRMTYYPDSNDLQYLPRRDFAPQRGVAGLWWDGTTAGLTRAGQGAYIRSYGMAPVGSSGAGLPTYLDAATLEYEPADGITTPPRFTRAAIAHPDSTAAYATRNTEQAVTDWPSGASRNELATGVRVARMESLVAWNAWADQARGDLALMLAIEGSRWLLQPLTLSTRKTGGFETYEAARTLLAGNERSTVIFLQRSWLPEYGIRPAFGIMGGSIGYSRGGWDLEFHVAPIFTTLAQHAISWSEIDDGSATYELQWWDEDHPRGLHESLTYEDIGYCSTGLNVTTIPPDTGWDTFVQ